MTKVITFLSIFEYQQAVSQTVQQIRRENNIGGVEPGFLEELFPVRDDLISSKP